MRPIWLAVTLFLAVAPTAGVADETPRIVTVEGQAAVSRAPDTARISMGVESRHMDMRAARENVLKVTREFLAFTARLDIEDSRVQASGVTIRPEYRWNNDDNQQELIGYLVQRNFEVLLENLDKLGDLIEGAVDAGVNQVSPPQLIHSRERDLRRQALAAAALDAEENARILAESLGATLGAVREVTSMETQAPPPMMREVMMAADAGGGDSYRTGEIRIEARVTAKFDLVAAQ